MLLTLTSSTKKTTIMNHQGSKQDQATKLTGEEIAKHNDRESCWVIVHGKAYDVTECMSNQIHCVASN